MKINGIDWSVKTVNGHIYGSSAVGKIEAADNFLFFVRQAAAMKPLTRKPSGSGKKVTK